MAIWDEKEETLIVTESADSHKCLSCGGVLKFSTVEGMLVCVSCGNRYYPETFEINEMLSERRELDIDSEEAKKRAEEDEYKIERKPKHEIVCNSCGATVVTEVNTVSTYCAFCGSTAIMKDRLKKEFRPDYIVPFKITKDEAMKKVKEWAKTRHFVPREFDTQANYEKITGIYVPFWLVDADCHMDIGGGGVKQERDGTEMYYDVRRRGMFKMRRVPFDGSKKINDKMMESIEPFDYAEMVPFVDSYLEGMYAERYDLSPKDMAERICDRFRDYMYQIGKEMITYTGYKSLNIDDDCSVPKNYKCNYALLPVWLLSFNYNGLTYRVAVNGQTGEIDGQIPESPVKRGLWKSLQYAKRLIWVYLAAILLLSLYMASALAGTPMLTNFPLFVGMCSIGAIVVITLLFILLKAKVRFLSDESSAITRGFALWLESIDRKVSEMNSSMNKDKDMVHPSFYFDPTYKAQIEKIEKPSAGNIFMAAAAASFYKEERHSNPEYSKYGRGARLN